MTRPPFLSLFPSGGLIPSVPPLKLGRSSPVQLPPPAHTTRNLFRKTFPPLSTDRPLPCLLVFVFHNTCLIPSVVGWRRLSDQSSPSYLMSGKPLTELRNLFLRPRSRYLFLLFTGLFPRAQKIGFSLRKKSSPENHTLSSILKRPSADSFPCTVLRVLRILASFFFVLLSVSFPRFFCFFYFFPIFHFSTTSRYLAFPRANNQDRPEGLSPPVLSFFILWDLTPRSPFPL